tara:strand:- start:449 stop:712 length:264 start_codon:yes stop_codon:yes gene_type:complete
MWWLFRRRNPEERVRIRKENESFQNPYEELLVELFADRGMLLGSQNYNSMSGVERYDALNEIDTRILAVKERMKMEDERCKQILKSS